VGITSQVNLQGAFSYGRNYDLGSHASTFEFGFKVRNAHKGQDAYSPTYDEQAYGLANGGATPPSCTATTQTSCTPPMTEFLNGFSSPNYYFGHYTYGPVTRFSEITGALPGLLSQTNNPAITLDEEATEFTSYGGDFDLTERVSAAYAMNTIEFGRFRLQTGLRLEATQLNILGYVVTQTQNQNTGALSAVTTPSLATPWYWDPFPSVQLRYRISDNDDIRAVYGRGGGPEFAVADGAGYVFNNLEDQSQVLKINSRTLRVEAHWPTAPCSSPSSMAMDRANRRLFIGCRSKVMAVINADTGRVITTLPIGDHVDATAFDSETKLIFNSNGEGTVTVIREDSADQYSVVQTVKTLPRAKTMALDPKTHRLFLSTAENGQFEVLVVGK